MSSIIETLAAKLAEDTMKAMDELGNDRLYMEVGSILSASSQSLEEAYLTEVRVRLSERLARKFLVNKVKDARSAAKQAAAEQAAGKSAENTAKKTTTKPTTAPS